MRSRVFLLEVLVCLLFTAAGLCACGASGDAQLADCPFSQLNWNSSIREVVAVEGEEHGSYDSVYGGVCYTYPREFEERMGTVKYMFDGDGYSAEHQTNYGGVWYRDNGDIILSVMITSETKALQFSFLSPAVSSGGQAEAR